MSSANSTAFAARSEPSVPTATVLTISATQREYFSAPPAGGKLVTQAVANVARRMARDWSELFIVDGSGPAAGADQAEHEEQRTGRFRRLRENLRKTRQALAAEIEATLFDDVTDETWERLEEALIYADVGARTTAQVVEQLEREASRGQLSGGQQLSNRLVELLASIAKTGKDRIDIRPVPTVILVAGVNGTGKTTTTARL